MKHIAIFVSGGGTNCENIIRYFKDSSEVKVSLVLSNKSSAGAVEKARRLGVETVIIPKEEFNRPEVLLPLLRSHHVDFIVLAGFLLFIPAFLIEAYDHRMINLHPSLLPKFGGKGMWGHHVHEAVKAAGEKETGMTVHWVSNEIDGGDIIAQYRTPLLPSDTPEEIAEKEHQLEMKYFPIVIEKILREI
ncbi:MAG: phosphoribosylglycinamide formyltransferase [Prevotella sp.]|jgi:phosphoribosylglycinamide formyltransferase-1